MYAVENEVYYNTSFLSAVAFAEKYGLSRSSVEVAKYKKNPYVYKIDGMLFVDEKKLLKRRDFYKKIWNKAHDNYYMLSEHLKDRDMAHILFRLFGGSLNGWYDFLDNRMFSLHFIEQSLLSYKINNKLWTFYRYSRFIIRRLSRYEGLVEDGKMIRVKSGGLKKDRKYNEFKR